MPTMMLANQYIPLKIVNETKTIFYTVIFHSKDISYLA